MLARDALQQALQRVPARREPARGDRLTRSGQRQAAAPAIAAACTGHQAALFQPVHHPYRARVRQSHRGCQVSDRLTRTRADHQQGRDRCLIQASGLSQGLADQVTHACGQRTQQVRLVVVHTVIMLSHMTECQIGRAQPG